MKTTHVKYGLCAALMLVLLASQASGWSISASWGSWNNYWNGYQWVTPMAYGGYYPYYAYPTTYVQPHADVVYATQQQSQNTNVVIVKEPQPYVDPTYVVYNQQTSQAPQNTNYCGDGWCSGTESKQNCPADCAPAPYCGDGVCNNGESISSCPYDCKLKPYCGDGLCNNAETKYSCPADCGLPAYCGDGSCNGVESKRSCPEDCGLATYCGDSTCNLDETKYNCPDDCGLLTYYSLPPYCGDGYCNGIETKYTCSMDCRDSQCKNPIGDENDETCRGREILICDRGLWDFKQSVDCCRDSDCDSEYECKDHRCRLDKYCGDGICNNAETRYSCPEDCGYAQRMYCGDGSCNNGETYRTCSRDCIYMQHAYCGDGSCDSDESCSSCQQDCGVCYICGDGVCNLKTENQNNCPRDCGSAAKHSLGIASSEDCEEIIRGSSGELKLIASNKGDVSEKLTLSASGPASSWVIQPSAVVVASGASKDWVVSVNVPANTEPGLYNLTIGASNQYFQGSMPLHVDVKLPELENNTLIPVTNQPTTTGGGMQIEPTGAFMVGEIAIPDWAIMGAMGIAIAALVLFILLKKTAVAGAVKTETALATDGGHRL